MRNFFWSDGNEKMTKTAKLWEKRFGREAKFVSFNIPQLQSKTGQKTCPYAGSCAEICYAGQGRMAFAAAKDARERNLEHINSISSSRLTAKLVADIDRMRKTTHVRIHDSGDFFNRSYYKAWVRAAEQCPDIVFYAYTKSIPLIDYDLHPSNFRLVQSLGGKRDKDVDLERPHSRIFATDEDRKKASYCDGNVSDIPAVLGQKRIGLVYHGVKNLTEDNIVQLRVG
jgi:hypothetical protein